MANKRIHWGIQAAGFARLGSTSYTELHGGQSVGLNLNFDLQQYFELGQLAIYDNKENVPEVEVTIEKVLDGYPLIYHLATRGYTNNTLAGRQNQRCTMALNIYDDTQNSASGVPIALCVASGLYLSSLSYEFTVDGPFTESVTLVGNNLEWSPTIVSGTVFNFQPNFLNNDVPKAITGSGGVQTRQNLLWATSAIGPIGLDANMQVDTDDYTVLPPSVYGITSSGTNNIVDGAYSASVQRISTSVDLGRDQIFELGRRGPYTRFITFPTEVRTEVETISKAGAQIDALEAEEQNLSFCTIKIKSQDGTFINLGEKNKLASFSIGGGDTGGGNQTVTYSYITYNEFEVIHPDDPVT